MKSSPVFEFRQAVGQLRVLVPPVWAVKVRRCALPEGCSGDCSLVTPKKGAPYYSVRVNRSLSEDAQTLILLHEWSHALSWGSESHRIRHHGPEFGIAYARAWSALIEE